jgi:hypothetical protein
MSMKQRHPSSHSLNHLLVLRQSVTDGQEVKYQALDPTLTHHSVLLTLSKSLDETGHLILDLFTMSEEGIIMDLSIQPDLLASVSAMVIDYRQEWVGYSIAILLMKRINLSMNTLRLCVSLVVAMAVFWDGWLMGLLVLLSWGTIVLLRLLLQGLLTVMVYSRKLCTGSSSYRNSNTMSLRMSVVFLLVGVVDAGLGVVLILLLHLFVSAQIKHLDTILLVILLMPVHVIGALLYIQQLSNAMVAVGGFQQGWFMMPWLVGQFLQLCSPLETPSKMDFIACIASVLVLVSLRSGGMYPLYATFLVGHGYLLLLLVAVCLTATRQQHHLRHE